MANLLIFASLTSAVIMMLAETVSLRLIYKYEFKIDIDYLLFNLILYPGTGRKEKRRRKRKGIAKLIKTSIRRAFATKRSLEFLFKHSKIVFREINIPVNDTEPHRFVLNSQYVISVFSALMAYLSLKSETLSTEDGVIIRSERDSEEKNPTLEITLKASLFITLLSFIIFIFESIKKREKRSVKNVRKQNERHNKSLT